MLITVINNMRLRIYFLKCTFSKIVHVHNGLKYYNDIRYVVSIKDGIQP
jgi:hypothetical protein